MIERDAKGRFINGGYWEGKKGDPRLSGENHWNWRGDNVTYPQLHKWARKQFGNPRFCWLCERSPDRIEMACINKLYTKSQATWAALCARCHRILDNHPYKRKGPENRTEIVEAMAKRKLPTSEIANHLGVSPRTIGREIKKLKSENKLA
jgi:DNA-binding transcriptional ArsR family regulator